MDHNFLQQGKPNTQQTMRGADPNHFDPAYFAGKKWDLADVANNEHYYKFSRQQYERDGRRIVDVTVGGKCQVFEKGDYLQHLYE